MPEFNILIFRYLLFSCLVWSGIRLNAQKAQRRPDALKITFEPGKGATLEFDSTKKIHTLLILAIDTAGVTVFMENEREFQGHYKKSIPLPAKGAYSLEIHKDEEKYIEKITFR